MEILPKLIRNQLFFITFCSLAPRSGENFDVRVFCMRDKNNVRGFCMRFPFDFDHYFVKSQRLMRGSATKKILKKPLKKTSPLRGDV